MTTGIIEKVFVRGTLTTLTGMRIGGTDQGLSVGGLQNIVVRHALLNEPYVPGSSLRGKIRCSLERLQGKTGRGHGEMIDFGPCDDPKVMTVQLFGTESADLSGDKPAQTAAKAAETKKKDEKETKRTAVIPSRLIVRDALLTEDSRRQLLRLRGDLPMTETKTEVCIDRVTSAANPRPMERVPAGAELRFEMVLEVRALPPLLPDADMTDARNQVHQILNDARNQKNHWGRDEDLKWILVGLDLLQDDALGGQGSRGYGRVKVTLDGLTYKTREDYEKGSKEKPLSLPDSTLKREIDELLRRIAEHGKDDCDRIRRSLTGAAA